jgi:hypothetical protein
LGYTDIGEYNLPAYEPSNLEYKMEKIYDESQNLIYYEMDYNENRYRFIPKSNYWICVVAQDWKDRWTICDDEFGLTLTKEAEKLGFNMESILNENGCSKRRIKILTKGKKKPASSSSSESFFSLFDEPEDDSDDDSPDDENFISLF